MRYGGESGNEGMESKFGRASRVIVTYVVYILMADVLPFEDLVADSSHSRVRPTGTSASAAAISTALAP